MGQFYSLLWDACDFWSLTNCGCGLQKKKKPHPALRKMPEKQLILFAWPIGLLFTCKHILCCTIAEKFYFCNMAYWYHVIGTNNSVPVLHSYISPGIVEVLWLKKTKRNENER